MTERRRTRGVVLPHLEAWRLSQALTQRGLADLAGVSRATIGAAEQGGNVRASNIGKLAAALHITPAMLIYWTPAEVLERALTPAR